MVFLKLFGLIDLAAALLFIFSTSSWIPARFKLVVALLLGFKGLLFLKDPVSKFDVVLAFFLLGTLLIKMELLSILFGLYLLLKGCYSMV